MLSPVEVRLCLSWVCGTPPQRLAVWVLRVSTLMSTGVVDISTTVIELYHIVRRFSYYARGMALADQTHRPVASVRSVDDLPPLGDAGTAAEIGDADLLAQSEVEQWAAAASDPLVPESLEDLDLATVLHALSDPVRLQIVTQLADGGERTCSGFELPVGKSTCSHHFRVLREAGVVAQRVDGKCRFNSLRVDELQQRFPGLLDAVLQANHA